MLAFRRISPLGVRRCIGSYPVRRPPQALRVTRLSPPMTDVGLLMGRRAYALRDRYKYPPQPQEVEKKAEEEMRKAEEQMQAKEKSRQRQMRRHMAKYLTEPDESVILPNYKPPENMPPNARCMTVAIVGVPNAGKSTLLNRLVGTRVSAVSKKSHTTRDNVLGVLTKDETQIIFIDTPGIIARTKMKGIRRQMAVAAWNSLDEADMVCCVIDCVKTITEDERDLVLGLQRYKEKLKNEGRDIPPFILLLNKYDLYEDMVKEAKKNKKKLPLPVTDRFRYHFENLDDIFDKIFPMSALTGDKVIEPMQYMISKAPLAPWMFSPEISTPMSQLQIVEEIIREKIFRHLNQELPFSVTQENIGWTELQDGKLRIDQALIVRKPNHKAIVIGKGGRTLYSIYYEAKRDIQAALGRAVVLQLEVKYREKSPTEEM